MVCVQGVAEAECRRAAAAAEEVYIREFNQEGTPAKADALLQEHLVSCNHSMVLGSMTKPLAMSTSPSALGVELCKLLAHCSV